MCVMSSKLEVVSEELGVPGVITREHLTYLTSFIITSLIQSHLTDDPYVRTQLY